jgi:hypothetical protein
VTSTSLAFDMRSSFATRNERRKGG